MILGFIPQLLGGEMGQQQSTEASGAAAKALLPFKIKLAEAVARGEIDAAQLQGLLAKFNLEAAQPPVANPDATIPEGFS
ncbi:MAG: hypothetical protein IPJ48_17770, partial [Propionivibrio sp.]|nr:hypothetical protein [Candidatus Propionivibrio dominans]